MKKFKFGCQKKGLNYMDRNKHEIKKPNTSEFINELAQVLRNMEYLQFNSPMSISYDYDTYGRLNGLILTIIVDRKAATLFSKVFRSLNGYCYQCINICEDYTEIEAHFSI